jgi:hypothetical protein
MSDGFCSYQATLLAEVDGLGEEDKFEIVDASADAEAVCAHLKKKILEVIEPVRVPASEAKLPNFFAESLADKIFANLKRGYEDTEHRAVDPFPLTPLPAHSPLSRGNGSGPRI